MERSFVKNDVIVPCALEHNGWAETLPCRLQRASHYNQTLTTSYIIYSQLAQSLARDCAGTCAGRVFRHLLNYLTLSLFSVNDTQEVGSEIIFLGMESPQWDPDRFYMSRLPRPRPIIGKENLILS